jgi:hypothetical protein
MSEEPHWATKKDAFGEPVGRYSWRGIKQGWSCHHCGGLFRGKKSLLEHQEWVLSQALPLDERAGAGTTKDSQ